MKLSIALLSACVTAEKTWFTKEWQVIEAYDNDQEIRLVDPNIRSNKQWHDCGAKPATPVNGRDVVCNGATCAAVCPLGNFFEIFDQKLVILSRNWLKSDFFAKNSPNILGWRSQGRWKIKCQADNTWSHSKFSPCVTCPDISTELDSLNDGVQVVEAFVKNLPVVRFFCGDSTDTMNFMGKAYKKGGNYKNAKCLCKNGQNGDPSWKKSCSWSFKGNPFTGSDATDATCDSKQPNNNQPDGNDSLDQNNADLDAQNQQDSDNQNNQ